MNVTREMLEHFAALSPIDTAVYGVTPDGRLEALFISENIISALGMTREELTALAENDAADMVLPSDRAGLRAAAAECVRSGGYASCHFRMASREKGFRWVHAQAHVCGEMDGRPLLLASFSNLTAESGIYHEVLDASDRMVLVIDRDTCEVLYANEMARMNSESGGENLLDQTCYSYLYGASRPCENCFWRGGDVNGDSDCLGVQRESRHGGWEQVTRRLASWCGHDAAVIFIKDVTEEKKQLEELALSRNTLSFIVDNLPVGLGVCTVRDGQLSAGLINQRMADLTGIMAENFTRDVRNLLGRIHPGDSDRLLQVMYGCAAPGSSEMEFRFLPEKETDYRWYQLMMRTVERDGVIMVFSCLIDISSEKYAGAEALKNRQMYRAAARASGLIIWEYDVSTRRITMMLDNDYTRETCQRLGIPERLENGPEAFSAAVAEKDRAAYLEMYRKMDAGAPEASCDFELNIQGTSLVWSMTCTAVRDENGGLVTVCGIGRDITAQRREQERFRREFQQLLSVNPEAIGSFRHNITKNWTGDGQGVFSDQFAEASAGTVDRHVSALASLIIDPEDRAEFLSRFSRGKLLEAFSEGKTREIFEYPLRLPDVLCHWVRGTLNMLRNPTTGDVEAVAYAADVTEIRKREEIARRVSEDEFDYVGIIYTRSREFEFYNKKAEIAFPALHQRMPYDVCMDYVCSRFATPEERRHVREAAALETITAALRDRGRYETSYLRTENGSASRRQLRYTWFDEPGGEILVVRTDVTAAYAQEQRQLIMVRDALHQAEQANAAKTDFLARMSHDLRTPLSGIIGLSSIAMTNMPAEEDLKRYLSEIRRSGEYLLGIINDILDMSKIESKKLELRPEVMSFADFCGTLRDVTDIQCARKRQTFEISAFAEGFSPYILADKTRFLQIFINLLTNAVKYTQEGGNIRLSIELISRRGNILRKRFTVSDNGIGMSPQFVGRAFEPFEREHDDSQGGTGLGLAIVKNLVELMGGTVRIDSAPGLGTSVTVELELEAVPEPQLPSGEAAPGRILSGKRFLICEDNDINAEIAAALLREVNAQSDRAENGRTGVEQFRRSEIGGYDAILMDVRMPEMDGLAAAAEIRRLDRPDAGNVPIIALTANAFDEDRESCIRAGMNAHLAKPIEPAALYAALIWEIQKTRKGEQEL